MNGLPEQLDKMSKEINEMWVAYNSICGHLVVQGKHMETENLRILYSGLQTVRYNLDNYIKTHYNIDHPYGGI